MNLFEFSPDAELDGDESAGDKNAICIRLRRLITSRGERLRRVFCTVSHGCFKNGR